MRDYREDEAVDFAIVGAGRRRRDAWPASSRGGLLRRCVRRRALSGGRSRISPRTRASSSKLYWTDPRITAGDDPIELGGNNSGRGVGGSTVHFTMISLRWRPEWFKSRIEARLRPRLADRLRGACEPYYEEAEEALKISGPVSYPWGPPRGRYPYRAASDERRRPACWRAAREAIGVKWAPTPLATVSAPRGRARPCVYRGFCNYRLLDQRQAERAGRLDPARARRPARRSATSRWSAGSRSASARPRVTGVHYHREGAWRLQKARNVVVAGYAIETPRLLLNSAMRAASGRAWPIARPGRHAPHDPRRARRLGDIRRGGPLVQGAAQHGRDASTGTTPTKARTSTAATPS